MDWFTKLEERRKAILFALGFLLIATLAVTCMRDNQSYDAFWHLRMGQDWVELGLSPWQDHYSFTYPGAEIKSPPVVFELAIYQATKWLGLQFGFKLFLFACTVLILFAAGAWLRHIKAPVVIYCLVLPTLVALLQTRAIIRPELISYAFSICGALFICPGEIRAGHTEHAAYSYSDVGLDQLSFFHYRLCDFLRALPGHWHPADH